MQLLDGRFLLVEFLQQPLVVVGVLVDGLHVLADAGLFRVEIVEVLLVVLICRCGVGDGRFHLGGLGQSIFHRLRDLAGLAVTFDRGNVHRQDRDPLRADQLLLDLSACSSCPAAAFPQTDKAGRSFRSALRSTSVQPARRGCSIRSVLSVLPLLSAT